MKTLRRIMMITWLLLASLLCVSAQRGNGQDRGVLHCIPQNLTLTNSDQMILLTWEDDPSCSALTDLLIYELLVLTADKQQHYGEVPVTPDQMGSTHSWSWTSYLPVGCFSHSVRLRSRYKNHTSPWTREQTLSGVKPSKSIQVFPRDRWCAVGSRATFYCVVPEGQTLIDFSLGKNENKPETVDRPSLMNSSFCSQTYALTVDLSRPSVSSCTDVKCKTSKSEYGACAFIGYPPSIIDLQCETQDLLSVRCHWRVERDALLHNITTAVYLLGRECKPKSKRECSTKVDVDVGEESWTLRAENKFGKVEITDKADLTKRVHMFPPKEVTPSCANARNVSLKWSWEVPRYSHLNITCQINLSDGETNTTSEHFGAGLRSVVLNDLTPHQDYSVKVRCGTTQHFWRWSHWSRNVSFRTKGDVPDALDVWMQKRDKHTIITWKRPRPNQTHGQITDYEVTWENTAQREQRHKTRVDHQVHSVELSLDASQEYVVTVAARNINGSSSPSNITISSFNQDRTSVNMSKINGVSGGFRPSWSASPIASCGYIVDWCPASGECSVEWLKVPPSDTNANIISENFKDGRRYLLSIYACTSGAPVLLETRQGYVREKIPDGLFKNLKWRQQNSDVEISWDPISLIEQPAFIQGYILYCSYHGGVISVSADKPEATSLKARNLEITSYRFRVKAVTAAGDSTSTTIDATLNSLTDNLLAAVIISLVTTFSLLSLITILCYRHWTCIKQTIYPPVPKPVLTGKWLKSPGEPRVSLYTHSETESLDVPELFCKSAAPLDGYVSQDDGPLVFSQTPKGYYNQPLKNCTLTRLSSPPTVISSQFPSSPFKGVFPNPSYNLMMKTKEHQSDSGPEHQEDTSSLEACSGYQPQIHIETLSLNKIEEDRDSIISCVSTYILLPQLSAE